MSIYQSPDVRKMCCCECQNTGEYDNLQHAYEHGWFVH